MRSGLDRFDSIPPFSLTDTDSVGHTLQTLSPPDSYMWAGGTGEDGRICSSHSLVHVCCTRHLICAIFLCPRKRFLMSRERFHRPTCSLSLGKARTSRKPLNQIWSLHGMHMPIRPSFAARSQKLIPSVHMGPRALMQGHGFVINPASRQALYATKVSGETSYTPQGARAGGTYVKASISHVCSNMLSFTRLWTQPQPPSPVSELENLQLQFWPILSGTFGFEIRNFQLSHVVGDW